MSSTNNKFEQFIWLSSQLLSPHCSLFFISQAALVADRILRPHDRTGSCLRSPKNSILCDDLANNVVNIYHKPLYSTVSGYLPLLLVVYLFILLSLVAWWLAT